MNAMSPKISLGASGPVRMPRWTIWNLSLILLLSMSLSAQRYTGHDHAVFHRPPQPSATVKHQTPPPPSSSSKAPTKNTPAAPVAQPAPRSLASPQTNPKEQTNPNETPG